MLLTATLALQCPGHLRLYIRLDYAGGEGMVAGARRVRRSTEREQATPVTARRQRQAAQGERPSTGSRTAASGLEALFDELDAAMSATAGTRDVCRRASTTLYTWREMSCVYRVSRL